MLKKASRDAGPQISGSEFSRLVQLFVFAEDIGIIDSSAVTEAFPALEEAAIS